MNRLRAGLVSGFLAHGVSAAANLLAVPVYLHYLGADALGLLGFLTSLQVLASLMDLGLTPMLGREIAQALGRRPLRLPVTLVAAVEQTYLVVALSLALALWVAAPWLAVKWLSPGALGVSTVVTALRLGGVAIAFQLFWALYAAGLRALGAHLAANALHGVGQATKLAGSVAVLILLSRSIEAIVAWQAAAAVGLALVFRTFLWRGLSVRPAYHRRAWRQLWLRREFVADLTVVLLLGMVLSQVDRFVISWALGLTDLGYYVAAATAAAAITLVMLPVTNTFTPTLARLLAAGDREALAATYHLAAQAVAAVAGPVALTLMITPQAVLLAWTRDGQLAQAAAPALRLLAGGTLLNALSAIPFALIVASGRLRVSKWTNVIALAVFVPALWGLAVGAGIVGVALGWPLLNATYVLVWSLTVERSVLSGEWARWWGGDVLRPVAAALVVSGACALLASSVPAARDTPAVVVMLGLSVGLSAAAAAAVSPALRTRGLAVILRH
jgi:O-antigen/teichoic acid export membrane protein